MTAPSRVVYTGRWFALAFFFYSRVHTHKPWLPDNTKWQFMNCWMKETFRDDNSPQIHAALDCIKLTCMNKMSIWHIQTKIFWIEKNSDICYIYIYNYFSLLLEKPFVWLNWGWASQCTYLYRYGWNWLGDKGLTAQGSTCVVNNQGLKSISKRREWEKDITGITLFPLSKQDHMNSVKLELMLD